MDQSPEGLIFLWHEYRHWAIVALVAAYCAVRISPYIWSRKVENIRNWRQTPLPSSRETASIETNDGLTRSVVNEKSRSFIAAKGPKRITGSRRSRRPFSRIVDECAAVEIQPLIFFFSLGGSTQKAAEAFAAQFGLEQTASTSHKLARCREPQVHDLSQIEYDDYFISPPRGDANCQSFYIFLIPTYDIDTVMHNFLEHLQETHNDFRIDTAPLAGLAGYSVFGFGDREGWPSEDEGFCSQAKEVDKWMAKLSGRKRAFPVGMGNVRTDASERLKEWRYGVQEAMVDLSGGNGLGEGVPGSGDPVESGEESANDADDSQDEKSSTKKVMSRPKTGSALGDLEDLGGTAKREQPDVLAVDFTAPGKRSTPNTGPKEMVPRTSPTYAALTKQGYTIVGSHSGVKICRWTKSALRGRGSCYKFSFYGIKSHLCMETTPSLSCSNKCVFCWRHGTNPVGTTWRWQVDPPDMIFKGVKEGHYKKIKMLKGVPGVRAERFQEAMRIRHCALSLVGEPIFYPHINEFLSMLHAERISSFLVCNAQHPDQLAALNHVTQLYVSIDASNRDSLRKIDRPLHRDFWERFTRCLDILRERRFMQRTVFRLTLVKGFNIDDEVNGYADLVERGLPCFVEVKGVTYCGTSTSSAAGLTMQNVPFYEEVVAFVEALVAELQKRKLGYGIAAEHAHSCCILIASDRFRIQGRWHTLIDYDKFFECLESGRDFGPEDYVGEPTPEWALWGNGGFDPRDERVDRKGRPKVVKA